MGNGHGLHWSLILCFSQFLSAPELSVRASLVHPDSPYEQVRCHERNSYPIVSGQQQTAFIGPVTLERGGCYLLVSASQID